MNIYEIYICDICVNGYNVKMQRQWAECMHPDLGGVISFRDIEMVSP